MKQKPSSISKRPLKDESLNDGIAFPYGKVFLKKKRDVYAFSWIDTLFTYRFAHTIMMDMKRVWFWGYLVAEVVLFLVLLGFQIAQIVKGYAIFDHAGPFFGHIGDLQFALTCVSLAFCIACFLKAGERERFDLFPFYFLATVLADFFFSFTNLGFIGHIFFFIAYFLFAFMRKAKWWEYLVALSIGGLALGLLAILGKLTVSTGIDAFLAGAILVNLVATWSNRLSKIDKGSLLLPLGVSLVFLSDASLAIRTFLPISPLGHAVALLTWPTYIAANVIFNLFYSRREFVSQKIK